METLACFNLQKSPFKRYHQSVFLCVVLDVGLFATDFIKGGWWHGGRTKELKYNRSLTSLKSVQHFIVTACACVYAEQFWCNTRNWLFIRHLGEMSTINIKINKRRSFTNGNYNNQPLTNKKRLSHCSSCIL